MSNFDSIKGIMDGYNPHVRLMEQTRKLVKKWDNCYWKVLPKRTRHGMAVLLENQCRLIN